MKTLKFLLGFFIILLFTSCNYNINNKKVVNNDTIFTFEIQLKNINNSQLCEIYYIIDSKSYGLLMLY